MDMYFNPLTPTILKQLKRDYFGYTWHEVSKGKNGLKVRDGRRTTNDSSAYLKKIRLLRVHPEQIWGTSSAPTAKTPRGSPIPRCSEMHRISDEATTSDPTPRVIGTLGSRDAGTPAHPEA